jgi:hypothetical protein
VNDEIALKVISASVAVIALALSIINFVRTSRVSDRQYVLAFTQDVLKWASDVLNLFRDLHIIIVSTKSQSEILGSLSEILHRLSIIWDKGRFLFPNIEHGTYGNHKDGAYQGIRRPILDRIAEFYRALEFEIEVLAAAKNEDGIKIDAEKYVLIRRRFVTEAQKLMRTNERFALAGYDKGNAAL